jgi:hypothetical protein
MIAYILLSLRYRYDHYESMGALYRAMNADRLRQTLDERLWGLFVEIIQTIVTIPEMDADELLEKIVTNPAVEQLIANMLESQLQEAG